jgi:hypothetical protein
MDNQESKPSKGNWRWLPEHMPRVVKLIEEAREKYGKEWVDECWYRGVVLGHRGWFFAQDGALMVGTLWNAPTIELMVAGQLIGCGYCLLIPHPNERPADGTY